MENVAYNMDCMEYMRSLPDKAFDLAVVDPPYGLSINCNMGRHANAKRPPRAKKTWDSTIPPPEYFSELKRVSQNQIIWGQLLSAAGYPFLDSLGKACPRRGFIFSSRAVLDVL